MSEINKADILGIVDYLINGDFIYKSELGPYNDDELYKVRRWANRCVDWLNEEANKLEEQ
jgi:hypothetical protein